MKVIYSEKQVADPGLQPIIKNGYTASPSAQKPQQVAEALKNFDEVNIEFVEPPALTVDDFQRCHSPTFVHGVMNLSIENGFGTYSQSVVDSLPYTNGAMYLAAKLAKPNEPTCALVSGFHHAGYNGWRNLGWFCTFNGLMIAATKLLAEDGMKKIAIIDCDMHWGNGTDDILKKLPALNDSIVHFTFGKHLKSPDCAEMYLDWLEPKATVDVLIESTKPDVIIYQAGADVHVDDPYGGVLTTSQMYERDLKMFRIAKSHQIPLAWALAGGYQVEKDGSIDKVLELHLNTFRACKEVYENSVSV